MATVFQRHQGVVLAFSPDGPMEAGDWAEWEQQLRAPGVTGFLTGAVGTIGFTSTQRQAAAELSRSVGFRTSVVTDDRLGRGIVTAVGWLGADIRAFSWTNIAGAAAYLDVAPEDRRAVSDRLWALRMGQAVRSVG